MNHGDATALQDCAFSLVVCTLGVSPKLLRKLFESLGEQTYRRFSVILVDRHRHAASVELVREFSVRFPIEHLHEPQPGLALARNVGLRRATGDIIAFPDDDCTYAPDLLERVARVFKQRPEIDVLSGMVKDSTGRNHMRFDGTGGPVNTYDVFRRSVESAMFLRRSSVKDTEFDESFGLGARWGADEGADYLLRLLSLGATIWYLPELVIHHPTVEHFDREAARKCYSYACARGRLFRKHGFSAWYVGHSLARTACGVCLSLLLLRARKAVYYGARFVGVLRGYFARA